MDDINAGFVALAGSSNVPDQLIVSTANLVSRKFVLMSGQSVSRGQVMGKMTITGSPTGDEGKVKKSLTAASDGTETPDSVAAETRDASAGELEILCYTSGRFNGVAIGALILGTGHTMATIREGLRGKGIIVDENPVLA